MYMILHLDEIPSALYIFLPEFFKLVRLDHDVGKVSQ